MKKELKKFLLRFPFLYRTLFKIKKKFKGINPRREGVVGQQLAFLLKHMGEGGLVLEIGTNKGQTTKNLAKHNFVVTIDPFLQDNDLGTLQGDYPQDVILEAMENISMENILLFPNTSEEAFKFWDLCFKKSFDSIFIDGLHTYEGVKTDFKWTKYLKKGAS